MLRRRRDIRAYLQKKAIKREKRRQLDPIWAPAPEVGGMPSIQNAKKPTPVKKKAPTAVKQPTAVKKTGIQTTKASSKPKKATTLKKEVIKKSKATPKATPKGTKKGRKTKAP